MSDEERFDEPRVAIDRVYTRGGDGGETSLVDGSRVPKTAPRIEAYGTVDELNSQLGLALARCRELESSHPRLERLTTIIRRVQHEAFNAGSLLATPAGKLRQGQARITDRDVEALEQEIAHLNADLPALTSFVLPGGSWLSAQLHVCRTVCRRAERRCLGLLEAEPETDREPLRYLNRLSDALFVWSRWSDAVQGVDEALWDPNLASGSGT